MKILQSLFERTQQVDILSRLRLRYIRALALTGAIIAGIGVIVQLTVSENARTAVPVTAAFLGFCLVVLALAQLRFVTLSGTLLIVVFLIGATTTAPQFLLVAMLTVISSAVLTSFPIYILVNVALVVEFLSNFSELAAATTGGFSPEMTDMLTVAISLTLVSVTTRYFISNIERAVDTANRNASRLQTTTEVGQFAATLLDLQELFDRSVDLIQQRFGFYHVQVFMVRDNQAELVASTGEAGQRLLANRHRLEVGSNSVIGRVTRYGEPVITRDTDADAAYYRNPLLPDTRAEMAVPIFEGDNVVGALDMQSTERDAFRETDVEALQSLANSLASAIRNARLFEEQNRSVKEQQRLYLESEANLREIQRLNRQLTKAGWNEYVGQSQEAAGVTLHDNQLTTETEWTENLIAAAQQRRPVTHAANGQPGTVAVPVILRGEVIGAIEVESGEDTDEAVSVDMVRAVAQRLATSLENARLFEESQAATAQEQSINRIVGRFQTAATVDDLLQITLTELSETLGARRGAIRLGAIPDVAQLNGDRQS